MGARRTHQNPVLNVSAASLRNILAGDAKELVTQAEAIGTALGRDLTTNQIRAIFGTVREIEGIWGKSPNAQRQLILLKPKMAYRASRDGFRGRALQALSEVLSEAIDIVTETDDPQTAQDRFICFVEFFEAILAYHKVAGGN
jgi:CRISPR-associated protein Csm2